VLVLIAILGLIRRMNIKRAARWVHLGWSSALLLGVVLWLCSEHILTISSAHRELMEGVVSLLAVTFLLYIGFWLHSKTEIHRWKEFVDGQVKALLKTGNLVGLMSIAFVAVFREAFETVLFLSTIRLEGGSETSVALLGGVSFAFILVVALAWAFLRFSSKVPIRTLFGVSSLLMGILAVIMTGKGMHALQETGILSITFSKIRIHSDLLGLYPTLETVAAQVLILAIVIGLWNLGKRPAQAAG
jgi:high-affinity iron transporter